MEKRTPLEWYYDLKKLYRIMHTKKETEKYYLFLDFDGVINLFYLPGTAKYEEKRNMDEFEFYDRDCVARLNELCHAFPIFIVISSSWRYAGLDYCIDYLVKAGLDPAIPVVDITDMDLMRPREEEILDYLFRHPDFDGFLIFDDGDMPHLEKFHVLTDPIQGFDEERLKFAENLLFHFR